MDLRAWRRTRKRPILVALLGAAALACAPPAAEEAAGPDGTIPITTDSEEARQAYLEGRSLLERLKLDAAREAFREAVSLDPDFPLAHLALADLAQTSRERFAALELAAELADDVSPGERLMIEAAEAGAAGDHATQGHHLRQLAAAYDGSARAHVLLADFYYDQQDWSAAIRHYTRATEIEPGFAPAYNGLGYARWAAGRLEPAEEALQRYLELVPDEPNPHDSYAELLMKTGRFEESAEHYRQALELDPDFVWSYVGLAHDQIFLGDTDAARATLAELRALASSAADRRMAVRWTVASHLYDEDHAAALEAARELYTLAEGADDRPWMAEDLVLQGDILRHGGALDAAVERYRMAAEVMDLARGPRALRDRARRALLYHEALVALAAGDLDRAAGHAEEYGQRVAEAERPAETRRYHHLRGLLALERGEASRALAQLEQADQQDPRVLLATARAAAQAGDTERAIALAYRAAHWNAIDMGFAFIRDDARRYLAELEA